MTSYKAKVPPFAEQYFTSFGLALVEHPVITQTYAPHRGWRRYGGHKRVSASWVAKLRRDHNVTEVRLAADGRSADFRVTELMRRR
jgi:hypothetical protein